MGAPAPAIVEVIRNQVIESVHNGHLAIARADGRLVGGVGDPGTVVYGRSALKPFQAAAALDLLDGVDLDDEAVAIAAASHPGSAAHQVEAARLLALADLDERALRCPPELPTDLATLLEQGGPTRLAHNCSGKHAAFLLAHAAAGGRPETYLRRATRIQRRARDRIAAAAGQPPAGPGVDGCGAPAWRLPLHALAVAFARLAGGGQGGDPDRPLRRVAAAMVACPDLVGGAAAADTALMLADGRVVAKRGAEGVLCAGFAGPEEVVGVAVKVLDGSARAAGPAVAAALDVAGATLPHGFPQSAVLGGGRSQGQVRPTRELQAGLARWAG